MIEANCESEFYLMDDSCSSEDSEYLSQSDLEEHFMTVDEYPTDKSPDPAELIREYCKICFRGQVTKNYPSYSMDRPTALKAIARSIYENSNYRIINSRILNPEKHYYPLYSLESLKLLVEEMQPVFNEADQAKRIDAEACEAFTRCRSTKIRPKGFPSRYEYVDIDTNRPVAYADFERRYRLFLLSLRCDDSSKSQHVASSKPISSPIFIDTSSADDDKENTTASQINISDTGTTNLSQKEKNLAPMILHANKQHFFHQETLIAMKSPRLINTTSQHPTTTFQIDL